jgi:isocitrate/isopropylmalate dehydrogenase
MSQPVHGTATDIACHSVVNPAAPILSDALLM